MTKARAGGGDNRAIKGNTKTPKKDSVKVSQAKRDEDGALIQDTWFTRTAGRPRVVWV